MLNCSFIFKYTYVNLSQQENPEDLINLSSEDSISDRLKNSGSKMNL